MMYICPMHLRRCVPQDELVQVHLLLDPFDLTSPVRDKAELAVLGVVRQCVEQGVTKLVIA